MSTSQDSTPSTTTATSNVITPTDEQTGNVPRYVTLAEFAKICSIGRTTIFRYCREDDFSSFPPPQRVGARGIRLWSRSVAELYRDDLLQCLPSGAWINIGTGLPIPVATKFYVAPEQNETKTNPATKVA